MTTYQPSKVYRLLFAAVLAAFYGGMAILWERDPASFTKIDTILTGTPIVGSFQNPYAHLPLPFFDLHPILSSRKCQLLGYDVIVRNPCDPMGRPTIYSPLLQHLPLEWVGVENTLFAGTFLAFAFLLSLFVVFRPESPWELAAATMGALSPAAFLAIERANLDILIFVLVVGAASLPQRYLWARLLTYVAAFAGFLIKFYPLALLVAAVRERFAVCFAIAAASAAGVAIFVTIYWQELQRLPALLPVARIFRGMFGGEIFPRAIQMALNLPPSAQHLIYFISGIGSFTVGTYISRKLSEPASRLGKYDPKLTLLLLAGLITVGCFFAGINYYYRAIFLLPALPGLFALRRNANDAGLRKILVLGIAAILFCLYADMVRLNGVNPLAGLVGVGLAEDLILGFRECIWWFVITVLIAGLVAYVRQTSFADILRIRKQKWAR